MLSCYNPMLLVLDILPVGAEFKGEIIDTSDGIVTKHLWSVGSTRGDGDEIVEVMNIDFLLISIDDTNFTISNFLDDSMTYKIFSKHSDICFLAMNSNAVTVDLQGKVMG